ncbi:MAG: MFS transporter [Pseudomonadota bacterium]
MVPRALRHPTFRIYVIGSFFGLTGMWLQRVVIGWIAWDLTGSASFVGLIAFLIFAPVMVSGPFFGVLADRIELRRGALTVQAILASLTAILCVVQITGAMSPPLLVVLTVLIGVVTSAHHPVRMALAPRLVPTEDIASSISVVSVNFNLTRLLGPAVAGVLIGAIGTGATLVVNLALFVPLFLALAVVRLRPREVEATATPPRVLSALRDGVRHAAAMPIVRRAMILTGLFALVGRGTLEILPAIADGLFAEGATGLGQITAMGGAGALVASLRMATRPPYEGAGLPRASVWAAAAGIVLVVALALMPVWWGALLIAAGLGFCGATVGIGMQSAIQVRLTDDMRGRVMSLWIVVGIGSAAFGAILLGALGDLFDLRTGLLAGAVVSGLAMLWVLRRAAEVQPKREKMRGSV